MNDPVAPQPPANPPSAISIGDVPPLEREGLPFPTVAIGTSAGGVEAVLHSSV